MCCSTGVSDDAELERVADTELVSAQAKPLGPGRPIKIGWMDGRARAYRVGKSGLVSVAFNDECDVVVAVAAVMAVASVVAASAEVTSVAWAMGAAWAAWATYTAAMGSMAAIFATTVAHAFLATTTTMVTTTIGTTTMVTTTIAARGAKPITDGSAHKTDQRFTPWSRWRWTRNLAPSLFLKKTYRATDFRPSIPKS